MFRTTDIVLIAAMVSAAAFTYAVKHEAENRLDHVRKLEAQIRLEKETIELLKADWSLLVQPARLQRLAEAFETELHLRPTEALQIVGIDEVPAPPLDLDDPGSRALGGMAGGQDATVTGSTVR